MPQYLSPGVYVEEVDSGARPIEGVGTAVAAFVGLAAQGPVNTPKLITNLSQFSQAFGGFMEGSYLAHAVYGYFKNGGGSCYVVRIGADGETAALPAATAQLTSGGEGAPAYRVTARDPGPSGDELSVEIVAPAEGDVADSFSVIVKRASRVEEQFDGLSTKRGKQNVVSAVNAQSTLIQLEDVSSEGLEPATLGAVSLSGGSEAPPPPARLTPNDYVGSAADRTGFGGLEAVDDVTMICVPDLMAAYQQGLVDLDGVQKVQLEMIAHCELMGDRVAILDAPPGLNAQQVNEWRVERARYDSKQATLYWPWLVVDDPLSGDNITVPPCGHVAGIWARSDENIGVHKAPANEAIRLALRPEIQITKGEQDLLNPQGINCLRSFPGKGVRVWGARTLSSDPAWKYLNVRRFFNYLEKSILTGTDWVVFEPNDEALWARIRRTIASFLAVEWLKGALFGSTPDAAFYVKCDSETNPSELIDLGQVVCEIGVAPVKPAEFVVFRLSQFSGGTSLIE